MTTPPTEPDQQGRLPADEPDRAHPVPWDWWDALLVWLVWQWVSLLLLQTVLGITGGAEGEQRRVVVAVLVSGTTMAVLSLGWAALRGQTAGIAGARRLLGWRPPRPRDLLVGLGAGIAGFVVVQQLLGTLLVRLIEALQREVPPVQEGLQQAVEGAGPMPVLAVIGAVVVSPVAEELLYRGLLFTGLRRRLPAWPAIGLSALAFALAHAEPIVIVLVFPFGLFLAWLYERRGTLLVPAVAHMVFNLLGVVAIRLAG